MSSERSRPWHNPTPMPAMMPNVLGQFDAHADWVNHASRALTGFTDSNGWELKTICVDTLGRRCANGGDFARARNEGTFPVRYFIDLVPNPDYLPPGNVKFPTSADEARVMIATAELYLKRVPE